MSGYHLIAIGLAMVVTPVLMAVAAGVQDNADFIQWLLGKPLAQILMLRLMVIAGVWLIGTGALYLTLPA